MVYNYTVTAALVFEPIKIYTQYPTPNNMTALRWDLWLLLKSASSSQSARVELDQVLWQHIVVGSSSYSKVSRNMPQGRLKWELHTHCLPGGERNITQSTDSPRQETPKL